MLLPGVLRCIWSAHCFQDMGRQTSQIHLNAIHVSAVNLIVIRDLIFFWGGRNYTEAIYL